MPAKVSPFQLASLLRQEKDPVIALSLFRFPNGFSCPPSSKKPFNYNARCYDLVVCKLGQARMFPEMEQILTLMQREKRVKFKEIVFCNVISFYGRARLADSAISTFRRIPSFGCERTIRSFNSLIHALLSCRNYSFIEDLCRDMEDYGVSPDACTYNIVINAACILGLPDLAWGLFDEMRIRKIQPSTATYGTLISFLCSKLMIDQAFKLKESMMTEHNLPPNAFIYTSLIKGLCRSDRLDAALKIKDEMMKDENVKLDNAVYSTLIKALFDAGRREEVVTLLQEMKASELDLNTVCYNAMIAGLCGEKELTAAFSVLNEMRKKGCRPDVVSYNVILSALCREKKIEGCKRAIRGYAQERLSPRCCLLQDCF